ncbi:hypothetical protein SAMN05444172_8981 [Burkholderia sp. GAS332]|nr:hypothetical protein SAMN05444172_8981 [Burkholderia sp. GAS332]
MWIKRNHAPEGELLTLLCWLEYEQESEQESDALVEFAVTGRVLFARIRELRHAWPVRAPPLVATMPGFDEQVCRPSGPRHPCAGRPYALQLKRGPKTAYRGQEGMTNRTLKLKRKLPTRRRSHPETAGSAPTTMPILMLTGEGTPDDEMTPDERAEARAMLDELLAAASAHGFTHADTLRTLLANGDRSSRALALAHDAMGSIPVHEVGAILKRTCRTCAADRETTG